LREQLRRGAYGQAQPLSIVDLARELDLSPTPVREALSRLAGEGLIEDRRGRGFFSARLDANDLTELYDLQHLQLGFAVVALATASKRKPAPRATLGESDDPADGAADDLAVACEALLDRLVRMAGHRALRTWHRGVSDRLGPARRVEAGVLADVVGEVQRLEGLFVAADWAELRTALRSFHRRRSAAVNDLAAALRLSP
jgi:DNA-binding GntR family transcriptional regulator